MDQTIRTSIHNNLGDYLETLRRERLLVEVECEVDPYLEVAEIHRRVIAAGGPAILFRKAKGSPFPLVTNLFGSRLRIDLAFGPRPQMFLDDLVRFIRTAVPVTLRKLWGARNLVIEGLGVGVRRTTSGPILANRLVPPTLDRLPVLTTWPRDGGAFFTLPLVYTESPETGTHNLGMYRMQRYDPSTTGMHWQIGKGGGFHHHATETAGKALAVNVFLGGPPSLTLAAIAPLPEEVPELLLASLLLGGKVRLVDNPAGPLPLMAEAEFALVGEVPPRERRPEGPFGDHYGYYSATHDYPVFRCQTLFHRSHPIFPATIVGKPRQEDFFLGDYLQELLSPLIRLVMPSVLDVWSYGETGYHPLASAVVRNRYPREAMMSAFRILGEGQLSLTKCLILVDRSIDLRDFPRLLEHVLARVRWESDLLIVDHLSMDTLDYTGPRVNQGSKAILLGLGDPIRELPRESPGPLPAGVGRSSCFVPGCLVVDGPSFSADREFGANLARSSELSAWPLVILVDDVRRTVSNPARFLWTTFTRFEPAADIHPARTVVTRHHLCYSGPVVIDARMKPWFPEEVESDPDVASKVTRRWKEYFPTASVEMGADDF